jgi:hypothetical protein
MDFPLDLSSFARDRFAQVILSLKADQKIGGDAKVTLETQRGIRRDAFFSGVNIAEMDAGNCHVAGSLGCRDFASFQFITDESGRGEGAEFHGISGCHQF